MRRGFLALAPALLAAPLSIAAAGFGQDSRRIERVEARKAAEGPWASLEGIVAKAGYAVRISTNKQVYRVGDKLEVTCEVTSEGYLNVLNVGEGESDAVVLYPNKYHTDNHVNTGGRITIPGPGDPFTLPAETAQRTLIVVVHTKTRLNGYETGAGDGFLKMLSAPATRSFAVAAAEAGTFGAGKAEVLIAE